MTSLVSMIKKLEPLGVYNMQSGFIIRCELQAYAAALDEHRNNIEKTLEECFINTADDYGIELREKMIGSLRSNYSLNKRREMLLMRNSFGENDFTADALGNFIRSLGVNEYDIVENPSGNIISVTLGGSFSDVETAWIIRQIKNFLPAHLESYVYPAGKTWHQFQLSDKTFLQLDTDDLTWSQIHMM